MCTYIVENNFCIGAGNSFSILYRQLSREYIKTLDKKTTGLSTSRINWYVP